MSKNKSIVILLTMLSIGGCTLANEAKDLVGKKGSGAFSCGQINAAFAAYNADRQSVEAYEEMARVTGMSTTSISTTTADAYYAKAVERANIALLLQGCSPIQ